MVKRGWSEGREKMAIEAKGLLDQWSRTKCDSPRVRTGRENTQPERENWIIYGGGWLRMALRYGCR